MPRRGHHRRSRVHRERARRAGRKPSAKSGDNRFTKACHAGTVGELANQAHGRRRRGRKPHKNRLAACRSDCMLIAISREVLLAMGCTGSRMKNPRRSTSTRCQVMPSVRHNAPSRRSVCRPMGSLRICASLPPDLPPPIALRRMHTSDPYCHLCHDQWEEMVSSGTYLKPKSSIFAPAVKHACSGRFNMSRSTWR